MLQNENVNGLHGPRPVGHPVGHPVSRKGDCWDNAPRGWPRAMESFFGTLKTECLHHFKFKTREHASCV